MARGELDQLMLMEQKATEQIDRTMATLKAIQDLGVNVSPAVEMMNQARIIQKQGNHPLAMELSKRAVDQAAHLMDMMASRKLEEVDLRLRREEMEGPDLVIVDRIRRDVNERINQRRFRDVLPLVRTYEEELVKVKDIRDSAQRTHSRGALQVRRGGRLRGVLGGAEAAAWPRPRTSMKATGLRGGQRTGHALPGRTGPIARDVRGQDDRAAIAPA